MFGVGPQEVVVIVLLLLLVFGPGKAVGMARDLGRFANTAREQVEEFKDELIPEEVNEVRHAVKDVKNEAPQSLKGIEAEVDSPEDRDGPATVPAADGYGYPTRGSYPLKRKPLLL